MNEMKNTTNDSTTSYPAPAHVVRTSKLLSKILRHDPGCVGVVLDPAGWVAVNTLLAALREHGHCVDRALLDRVVAENDKKRFAFDASGTRIRASQGHSIGVDLGLPPADPPATLYHGTGAQTASLLRADGIKKMRRDHVHLSPDHATAVKVGARHGRPVVFPINAGAMHRDGHVFHRSENGVWLTDYVPARYMGTPLGVDGSVISA